MEGNKDDALKCLRIGKEALESADQARALKFFSKARRLDPSLPIDHLLSAATGGSDSGTGKATAPTPDGPDDSSSSSSSTSDEPQAPTERPTAAASSSATSTVRNRAKGFSSSAEGSSSSSRTYTEEHIAVVRQINKQKDYYQILGLERSCTVEDVRKAYRKLSLKVHPDKNKAPGSEEAFKAVSRSFQCLSNEESRKMYDISGSDEPSHSMAAARHEAHGFNGFYEADFDPDEIFRSFFFGGMPPATTQFGTFRFRTGTMRGHNVHETHVNGNVNLRALLQILPVLILLLVNFLPSSSPVYTLSREYPYEHKVVTPRGVPYFVKLEKFEQEYPYESSKRAALEEHVERDFFGILAQNCRIELQRQQWGLTNQTPHCDMLRKYEETAA